MKVRRLVTGHDEQGRSTFASDDLVEFDGVRMLWGADEPPVFPDSGSRPHCGSFFPRVDGYRFSIVELQPGIGGSDLEPDGPQLADLATYGVHLDRDQPGMHRTETIDFEVILSGQIVLELDDGAERVLNPGDTVVQNGTRHRWRVDGNEPAVMAVFMVGARNAPSVMDSEP